MKKIISVVTILSILITITTGCQPVDKVIATVNGEDVKMSLYNICLSELKSSLQAPPDVDETEYWNNNLLDGKHVSDFAKENALDKAIKLVLVSKKAKDAGLKLSMDDSATIRQIESSNQMRAGGSAEAMKKYLADQFGTTPETFKYFLEADTYFNKLKEKTETEFTEDQMKAYYDSSMINVRHILIKTIDDQMQPLQAELIAQGKEKLEEGIARINSGEDFETVRKEIDQDVGDADGSAGYTLSKHSNFMLPFLYKALTLEVDEVSDVVSTVYGYHVIKRYQHVGNNEMYTAAQTEIKNSMFGEKVDQWKSEANVTVDQTQYDSIVFNNAE